MKKFKYEITIKMYDEESKKITEHRENLEYSEILPAIKDVIKMYNPYITKSCQCLKIKVMTRSGYVLYNKRYVIVDNKLVEFSSKIRRAVENIKL